MTIRAVLVPLLCVAIAAAAFAATKEEVILRDGTTGMVEVVETAPDSITVKFKTEQVEGQTKLMAIRVDPSNFYDIRRRYMESTAENHIQLAMFCIENGLFNRGKHQVEAAKAIDPEILDKIGADPQLMEKIAARFLSSARGHEKSGNLELAHEIACRVATKFPETKAADEARAWLAELEAKGEAQHAEKEKAREERIAGEEKEERKAELKKQEKVLKPIRKTMEKGRKLNAAGLQEKSQSKARSAYDKAAAAFVSALGAIERETKKAGDDTDLVAALADLDKEARGDAVEAYLNAGNVELGRSSLPAALKYADKALAVDPESSAAKAFQQSVQAAGTDLFWLQEIRDRRPRGAGGGGGGRR